MRKLIVILIFCVSTNAQAETPVSPAEFEAIVQGGTFIFSTESGPYGVEEYFDDRRVRWSFLDGECHDGSWHAAGDRICFEYDDIDGPQCWRFYLDRGGLFARFASGQDEVGPYFMRRDSEPVLCLGPKVGA